MIDFNQILSMGLDFIQTAVLAGVGVFLPLAIRWILAKTRLDGLVSDDVIREYLYAALENGVVFAIDQARGRYGGDVAIITIKNEILEIALKYIVKSVPDAIAHFEISEERLKELITVRLNKVLGL